MPNYTRRAARAAMSAGALCLVALGSTARPLPAQWVTTYEQFYLQASHNWEFRRRYVGSDRLFNAFDYGHAILYETLWAKPNAPASALEETQYDYLTRKVLVRPPRVPLEEGAIEVRYARLAPEAKQMFEWAHILHRQLYDVLADEGLSQAQKDAEVARVLAYYKTRRDLAFSSRPKSMALMQEQPYSLAFRQRYPKFNGLIWAYHWMQVGLYEPLLTGRNSEERQAGVRATTARFWQMLGDAPRTLPYQMPMTAAVAPRFAERYPEAAIIFDNLHSMHDVISDILANPAVPRGRKRAEILLAARRFRDDTSYVMASAEAWRTMSMHMGVENMGGPAVGFLPSLPTPTVTYGAVMTHDDRTGEMTGFKYGQATGGAHPSAGSGQAHGHVTQASGGAIDSAAPRAQAGHEAAAVPDSSHGAGGMPHDSMHTEHTKRPEQAMELQMRMLADPVIRKRLMADTAMRRMLGEMVDSLPPEHREHMRALMQQSSPATRQAPARRPAATTPRTPARRVTPQKAPAADPHAGHAAPPKPAARDSSAAPHVHKP